MADFYIKVISNEKKAIKDYWHTINFPYQSFSCSFSWSPGYHHSPLSIFFWFASILCILLFWYPLPYTIIWMCMFLESFWWLYAGALIDMESYLNRCRKSRRICIAALLDVRTRLLDPFVSQSNKREALSGQSHPYTIIHWDTWKLAYFLIFLSINAGIFILSLHMLTLHKCQHWAHPTPSTK